MSFQTVVRVEQTPSPAPTGVPGAPGATPGQLPQALTSRDIASLRQRRSELSRQLSSAEDRRTRLSESLKGTDGTDRLGILQRIEVLDKRIVQIEQDIAETGREITSAPLGLTTSTEPATRVMGLDEDNFMALAGGFTVLVLFPLALALARIMWKRAITRPPAKDVESDRRMERIEQALDSIAIEIERVSENQRFTTRMLNEANALPALPAGQRPAEPIRIPERESVRGSRESA
jgi:hypothetical protein